MAKPTLGYPSITAAAFALQAQGCDREKIAEQIGVSRSQVASLLANGQGKQRLPSAEYAGYLRVPFAERDALEPAAVVRNMAISKVAGLILSVVVRDNLIDAILDDGIVTPAQDLANG